jgi:hypothetical protein
MSCRKLWLGLSAMLVLSLLAGAVAQAGAQGLSDDGGAEWRVEQPELPPSPPGVEGLKAAIGLGRIGDIQFWAPNRGALITSGNGSAIPPGVWFYNGERWRELATVCGATDGHIAWAGPDEFWTISDGRPGQAPSESGEEPPLQDDTLCHFGVNSLTGKLEVLASYASLAFLSTSYQPMHAAACLGPEDCWFAGEPLESPDVGAFHLHWNGHTLAPEPYLPEGHGVWSMATFDGHIYEGVRFLDSDRSTTVSRPPPALHLITGAEAPQTFEPVHEVPLYETNEFFSALDYLRLSADESSLWAAAGPVTGETPKGSLPAGVTIVRYSSLQCPSGGSECSDTGSPSWSQVLGPQTAPSGLEAFPEDVVSSIAAEPGTSSAWVALDSKADAENGEPGTPSPALVARVSANGTISDELQLPSSGEPYGPKGAAEEVVCPAVHDCWMATADGWLLHLSTTAEHEEEHEENGKHPNLLTDPAFSSDEPIAVRPPDEGVPQVPLDAPPLDDSGLEEFRPSQERLKGQTTESPFATVTLPLLSHVRSRLVHGTTLELSFHLAVKARVRLLAKHRRAVVASTSTRTLKAGNRSLLLRLSAARWPTKLELQTHPLAPLPTASTREAGTNSVTTSLAFPNARGPLVPLLPFSRSGKLF